MTRTCEGPRGATNTEGAKDEGFSEAPRTHSTKPRPLCDLPAMRRARAEALLAAIDRYSSDLIEHSTLAMHLVASHRSEVYKDWTRGELGRSLDDLVNAGVIRLTAGRYGRTVNVVRIQDSAA